MGERWLTGDVIDTVFGIINRKHDDTICFVCKPIWIVYSSAGLSENRWIRMPYTSLLKLVTYTL